MEGCEENESCSKVLNYLVRLDDRIRCTHEETADASGTVIPACFPLFRLGVRNSGFNNNKILNLTFRCVKKKKSREEKKKLDKIANGVPVGFSVHVLAHFYDPS